MRGIRFRITLSLCLLWAFSACSPTVDMRGHVTDPDWRDQIIVGQSGREEVVRVLGTPSSASSFGAETWYYVSAKRENLAFFKPEVAEQDVIRIVFDAGGLVTSVDRFGKDDSRAVDIVGRTTPTEGHSLNFFEQMMGNVGRFNAPDSGTGSIGPRNRR